MNAKLNELVDYYENNRNIIVSNWKEAEVRIELINPFFECLGWDVNNNQKLADAFKEVRHEASLKIGSTIKAPDYSFNYGKRLFYLEAKTPSVNIKSDISPAYQLRRYGWTAKLPISILSDFEELAIYDCRIKPNKTDNAGIARVKYYTYKDYLEKWDEICNFISKDAVLHGSLNNFENKQLKGTASIDDDFLNSIENWRKLLALNIALRNPELSENELNFSIQMTIDRIIFLRICEDRGIENYELLRDVIRNGNCYENLLGVFQRADEKYNSGLFHFNKEKDREETPDSITPKLKIDDKTLKDIISDLYYPDCPYELAVISSDVLGNVYERFLGKVISLSKTHKAIIDFKPEVRKAGGVYYTPHYIVEYIVKNTVGEILKEKTPAQVSKIKICDPACGSGSFLIEAYQYLLNWHLNYYLNNDLEKWKKGKEPKIFNSQGGLQLTLSERKRILLNNIFGVDIDKNAVEVTKLSLILKVLEYEGQEVYQKSLFNERILPDLYNNIKCGNSLIGSDFYKNQNLSLFGNDEMQKINVFDWEKEFSGVFDQGGFDCVIGNPPYVLSREVMADIEKKYYQKNYKTLWEKPNTFTLFMEKGLSLLDNHGLMSFIIPNSWLTVESSKLMRKYILEKKNLLFLDDILYQVFYEATVETTIFVIENFHSKIKTKCRKITIQEEFNKNYNVYDNKNWLSDNDTHKIYIPDNYDIDKIITKILTNSQRIGDIFDVRTGLQAYEKGKGTPKQSQKDVENRVFDYNYKFDNNTYPYIDGKNCQRYYYNWDKKYLRYGVWLSQPRSLDIFSRDRIITREITGKFPFCIIGSLISGIYLNNKSILNILDYDNNKNNLKFLLAQLNSKLLSIFYKSRAVKSSRNIFPKIVIKDLNQFPCIIKADKSIKDNIVSLVDQMLFTQRQLHSVNSESDKKTCQQKADIIDKQINDLVFKLYSLTDEEIKIVEGTS